MAPRVGESIRSVLCPEGLDGGARKFFQARKRKERDSQWSTCYHPFLPPTTRRWIRSPSLHEMDRRTLETRIAVRTRDSAGTSQGEENDVSSVRLVREREAQNWNHN